MIDTLTEKQQTVTVVILCISLFISGLGIGAFILGPPPSNNTQTPTTNSSNIAFNGSELVQSHQTKLDTQQPYKLTLTSAAKPPKNATLRVFYAETVQVQHNGTHITTGPVEDGQTEMWVTANQTLLYYADNDTVEETTLTRLDDRQTKYLFLKQMFDAGEFKYTNISVTGESTFVMTELTNKEQLLYAYPGLSGQTEGEVRNVTISGTVQNGVVTQLNGTFDFKPIPAEENASQEFKEQRYTFNFTINTSVQPQSSPIWTQQYTPENNTTTENSSLILAPTIQSGL